MQAVSDIEMRHLRVVWLRGRGINKFKRYGRVRI